MAGLEVLSRGIRLLMTEVWSRSRCLRGLFNGSIFCVLFRTPDPSALFTFSLVFRYVLVYASVSISPPVSSLLAEHVTRARFVQMISSDARNKRQWVFCLYCSSLRRQRRSDPRPFVPLFVCLKTRLSHHRPAGNCSM